MNAIDEKRVDELYRQLKTEAEEGGYNLHPDEAFAKSLVRGLLTNEARYGYRSCPCRLADGEREKDIDIICPCYYRDPDISDYGACYCALYVDDRIAAGKKEAHQIPERRPPGGPTEHEEEYEAVEVEGLPLPVWRCKVCGYLCARPQPPQKCPVCKATKDRFERFM
jgi:ferredoxin-thioredoxin reductase catalytic chain